MDEVNAQRDKELKKGGKFQKLEEEEVRELGKTGEGPHAGQVEEEPNQGRRGQYRGV